jgi:hypothetical protein
MVNDDDLYRVITPQYGIKKAISAIKEGGTIILSNGEYIGEMNKNIEINKKI